MRRNAFSVLIAFFALSMAFCPFFDFFLAYSPNKPIMAIAQEPSEEPEVPEFERFMKLEVKESLGLLYAKKAAIFVDNQFTSTDGSYKQLELFQEANTPAAIAFAIMGLARGAMLFGDPKFEDRLVELANQNAQTAEFFDEERGYGRNAQGLYYQDRFGLLIADTEINLWMSLALLDAFLATENLNYLTQANRTFNALNATHWSGNYNGTYVGYLRSFEVEPISGQVIIPEPATFFEWIWTLRDQLLALRYLRAISYFSNPSRFAQIHAAIAKIENLLPVFRSNSSYFEEAAFPLYQSLASNFSMTGEIVRDDYSEIIGLDQVLLYGDFVAKGIQSALGATGERALQSQVANQQIYAGTSPANLALAAEYLKNASDVRRTLSNYLSLEGSNFVARAAFPADAGASDFMIDFAAETSTNFIYVTILAEYAKMLSSITFAESINLEGQRGEILKVAYGIASNLVTQGVVDEETPIFEGAVEAGGEVYSDPGFVYSSRPAANAWAISALGNILPIEINATYYQGIERNTNQTINISVVPHPSATLAWSPSVLGRTNFSINGIRLEVDFQFGEKQIPQAFLSTWAYSTRSYGVTFNATKDEPGIEIANVVAYHFGFPFVEFDIIYDVVGQAVLNIETPAEGWSILEGEKELRIRITASDWDGTGLSGGRLEVWIQTSPEWLPPQVTEPFASPRVITLTDLDKLDTGTHLIRFFLEKAGYLPAEFIADLTVEEPSILDRIRPLLESELAWWLGQLLIALGVLWKFNTIIIRRLRGKITTCSQCGSVTATAYPRCSACGHLWTEEGVSDMKGRIREALGDVAGEVGLPITKDED
ncbi:MAG: hypothetical protein ACFFGZ_03790 [Candidatus Thorarchaeota archaeon]